MGKLSLFLTKFFILTLALPFLASCTGKGMEAGLETSGLKSGDQVVIEMKDGFSVSYEMSDGAFAGANSPGDPISFSITNEKPVSGGEPQLSFTVAYLRPEGDSFSEPGLKIYHGLDFCTRDNNGDPIYSSQEASAMSADYQPVLNISGGDHNLNKGQPINISGEVVGVQVNRGDGSSNYYTRDQLLQEITYENPGGISDCKLRKNHIMSYAVNSPIRIKLMKAPPKEATFDDSGTGPSDSEGTTLPGGPAPGPAPAPTGGGAGEPATGCSLGFATAPAAGSFWILFSWLAFMASAGWLRRRSR
jgi:hypothetical protein